MLRSLTQDQERESIMGKKLVVPTVRIAPDSRNASKDYFIPASEAKELIASGKLAQDLTNSKPGELVYIPVGGK